MLITAASLGLKPDDFWGRPDDIYTGLTLREFDLFVQGKTKEVERSQEMLAWHAANIMSMWAKKGSKITPAKLLGRSESITPEEMKAKLAEKAAKERRKESIADKIGRDYEVKINSLSDSNDEWIDRLTSAVDDDGAMMTEQED